MLCPSCQATNPDAAKFCLECGTAFPRACPRCGAKLPTAAKFCLECGQDLRTALPAAPAPAAKSAPAPQPASANERPDGALTAYIPRELQAKLEAVRAGHAMLGERRVVTMLFCDVKGSTAAAERLDPEDWAEIMNGAFEHLIAPVYRYEGTLARLMGDAVLAFFGAPIAHEDDPQRAILAGLAMIHEIGDFAARTKRKWGIDFAVRVGINTGLVVVGEVGSDMRLEYTAMGDAVNLAARMEQTAAPGTVQISTATHKLVEPLFDFEALGEVAVKGKENAVAAYRVVGPKAKPGRLRGLEGLESPLIGRDRELSTLRGLVDALARGSGRIVSIQGEAGLGKSRLVSELSQSLRAEQAAGSLHWLEGRSLSYQTSAPFAPIVEILRGYLGLAAAPPTPYQELRKAVLERLGEGALVDAPFLASLLEVAVDDDADADKLRFLTPPDLRRRTEIALVDTFERMANQHPTVVVFEDLHWADPSSLALLDRLMPVADRAALLVIALFRPRRQEPSWKFHETASRDFEHRYLAIHLEPLEDVDARRLVANLLHVEGLPSALRELILSKAEGNPYFVEEVIRSLIDAGAIIRDGEDWRATRAVDSIPVPDTLSAVLTTRLDRLDEQVRRVVQTASVLGREFAFDTLASVMEPLALIEDALTELQRRGLVRERARIPTRRYAFKHVLVQESAYATLLLKSRRELHQRVANALVRIAPGDPAEIARHYLEAREPVRALPFLVDAAERAARAYSAAEALSRFDQAVTILESGVDDVSLAGRIYEGRGSILTLRADVPAVIANYEAMRKFAQERHDDALRVSALNKLASVHALFLGDTSTGAGLLDESEKLADETGCTSGMAEQCMVRCYIHTFEGEFDRAYGFLDRAASLGRELQADEMVLFGMTHVANTLIEMTEYDRAWPKIQEAMQLAEQKGNKRYLSELKTMAVPMYSSRMGDMAGALAAAREGAEIAEQIGHAMAVCNGAIFLGSVATAQGRFDEGIAQNERALHAARALGMPMFESMALCTLGTSYLEISAHLTDKATALHREAMQKMQLPTGKVMAATNLCEIGFCALSIGKAEDARRVFEDGLRMKSATMLLLKPHLHAGAGLAAVAQGHIEDARHHAGEGRQFAEARSMRHVLPVLVLLDARLASMRGRSDDAIELFGQVESSASALGYRPLVWKSCAEAARLLDDTGRPTDAAARRARGRALVDEIVAELRDETLAASYRAAAEARLVPEARNAS